jgi:hypothetical protein
MLLRLTHRDKRATQIGGDHPVEDFQIAFGDRPQRHDADAVHHDINPAEGFQRISEEALDVGGVRHIRLDGDRSSTRGLDLGHGRVGLGGVAGIVHHDSKTVTGQSQGHRAADAARSACDDGSFC